MKLYAMKVAVVLAAMAFAAGCGKKDGAEGGGGGDEPAKMVPAVIEIEPGMINPGVKVELTVPEGWEKDDFFKGKWMPKGAKNPMDIYVEAKTSCGGECSSEKIPGQIAEEMKGTLEDIRTGGIMKDKAHFKGTVKVLGEGELAHGGRYHAFQATYPEPPEGVARPIAGTQMHCYLHNEGDDLYVRIEAKAKDELADQIWPAFESSCKGAKYTITAPAKR